MQVPATAHERFWTEARRQLGDGAGTRALIGVDVEVVAAEVDQRDGRRRARRIVEARFPRLKRLEDFDTAVAPAIAPATLAALGRGAWIDAGEPVVLLGDSGTGKSHLLIALGMAACEAGRRVRYVTCASWVNELAEACDDRLLSKVVARYGRLDLLLVDELGYVSVDPKGWRRASWNPDAIALAASAPASSST